MKADGFTLSTADSPSDDVFEPAFSSRQHPRHHRPKVRLTVQTVGTESEEARVAAEGEPICTPINVTFLCSVATLTMLYIMAACDLALLD